MPWKESSVMDERLRFVARLLEGEQMSHLCREFGISRKTGYKHHPRGARSSWSGQACDPSAPRQRDTAFTGPSAQ
jgi:transposase-like protein